MKSGRPLRRELTLLARRDSLLGSAMRTLAPFPGFPNEQAKRRATHYDELVRAIVYQQLAGAAAATIHRRACALGGGRFPRHADLSAIDDVQLRAAGLSANKIAALRDLALRTGDGRLKLARLGRLADEAVIEELVQVRGIGVWSAQMFLIFRLGRLDVLASGDLGVQEGLRVLDGLAERPSPREVEARAAVWAPLRSVACWYLWRSAEAERVRARAAREDARGRIA